MFSHSPHRHCSQEIIAILKTCAHADWAKTTGCEPQGSPVDSDQGKYDKLTFWEQFDDGMQNTPTRKFFTAVPVVTFLLAIHGSDYRQQPLFLNLLAMVVSVVSKFPALHKVRLFGINKH